MPECVLSSGCRVHYVEGGEGRPLLQLHGSALDHRAFVEVNPRLQDGRRTIDIDLPGYGLSDPPEHDGSIDALTADIADFIRQMGHERMDVHGTSFGGLLALQLAGQYPGVVDRLVVSACLPRYDRAARFMRSTWQTVARAAGMGAAADAIGVSGFSHAYLERDDAEARLEWLREASERTTVDRFVTSAEYLKRLDLMPFVAKITARTLLIAAENDVMCPLEVGASGASLRTVDEILPDSRLVVIPESGHYLIFEKPLELGTAIAEFLDE